MVELRYPPAAAAAARIPDDYEQPSNDWASDILALAGAYRQANVRGIHEA